MQKSKKAIGFYTKLLKTRYKNTGFIEFSLKNDETPLVLLQKCKKVNKNNTFSIKIVKQVRLLLKSSVNMQKRKKVSNPLRFM